MVDVEKVKWGIYLEIAMGLAGSQLACFVSHSAIDIVPREVGCFKKYHFSLVHTQL